MIWVAWRQHRTQAVTALAVFCVLAVFSFAVGSWMRTVFDSDGLGACLARSGGAGCAGTITSFVDKFSGPIAAPLALAALAVPGMFGAATGAPLLGRELERDREFGARRHRPPRRHGARPYPRRKRARRHLPAR